MADTSVTQRDLFISRAGENADIAIQIAAILRKAGYSTFIQDQDFGNTNFMANMADGFAMVERGARVIAVLSPHYLKKEYCLAEAQYPLTGDPHNRRERLIVLRVSDCAPTGFLKGIPYVDLVPLRLDAEGFARAVRNAVAPRTQEVARARDAQVLHSEIRPVPGFAGRQAELEAVEAALWSKGGTAALTNVAAASAAVKGLGGVGKSVLAQEYAWRNRGRYHGVWWIRAEKSETLLDDLIELGARFIPGLKEVPDRAQAAHAALDHIAQMKGEKPWLLVYDNVAQPGDIAKLTPVDGAHVLITTRWSDWGRAASPVKIGVFPAEVAAQFLLDNTERTDRAGAEQLAATLGFLPLALDHAAAYCRRTGLAFDTYRELAADLIRKAPRGADYADEEPVFATFELAIRKAAEACPAAETLMGLCAFLAPERIPLDIVTADVMSEIDRGEAVAVLQEVSLASLETLDDGSTGISVHRLVQAVMRGRLGEASSELAVLVTKLVADRFPGADRDPGDVRNWPACARLYSHSLAVLDHASQASLAFEQQVVLSTRVAIYAEGRADYATSHRLKSASLPLYEKIFGADHPETATALGNFGHLLATTNCLSEAEPLLRRALAIDEKSFGPEHPNVAICLNNLARLLQETSRLSEAEPLMRQVVSILEKVERDTGHLHPNYAGSLNNLAALLRATNRPGEAEPLMRRALAIDEKSFGPEHPKVAIRLNNLGSLLKATNRLGEAEPLMRRSVDIKMRSLGPDHPSTKLGVENLAALEAEMRGGGS